MPLSIIDVGAALHGHNFQFCRQACAAVGALLGSVRFVLVNAGLIKDCLCLEGLMLARNPQGILTPV